MMNHRVRAVKRVVMGAVLCGRTSLINIVSANEGRPRRGRPYMLIGTSLLPCFGLSRGHPLAAEDHAAKRFRAGQSVIALLVKPRG